MSILSLPDINNDVAQKYWTSLSKGMPLEISDADITYDVHDSEAQRFSDLEAEELFDELELIRSRFEIVNSKTASQIDSAIVKPIHDFFLGKSTPKQLGSYGFWRWLSNCALDGKFWDFVMWRFDSDALLNWGITTSQPLFEVYFFRAWLRGHMLYDSTKPNPYEYSVRGSTDFWRSHVLRQDFSQDPEFVKAFIDSVYDEDDRPIVATNQLRTQLIPALRAWSANASFSHLSYEESLSLISMLLER